MPVTRPRDKSAPWEPTHATAPASAAWIVRLAWPLALLLTACASAPSAGPATAPEPGQAGQARTTTGASQPAPAGLSRVKAAEQTRKIMEAVAKARALPVTGEVAVEVMHRAEIRDYAKASMYEHNTPEQIRLFTRIEASMGVLPVGPPDASKVAPAQITREMTRAGYRLQKQDDTLLPHQTFLVYAPARP